MARRNTLPRWVERFTEVADTMNEIILVGLVAIAVVIVIAGLLGRLVDRDDLPLHIEP
jgi:hypothetical protein